MTRTFVGNTGDPIVTHYAFDDAGRVQHVFADHNGDDEVEAIYTYDLAGNVVDYENFLGQHTRYDYDALNRVNRVTQADPDDTGSLTSPVTFLAYNAFGQLSSTIDPLGQVRRNEYDSVGNLTATIAPLGAVTQFSYDAAGQLGHTTDAMGRITGYNYDDAGRLIAIHAPAFSPDDPAPAPTTYQYDSASNLRKVYDPLSNLTQRFYDERGRLTEIVDANNDSTLYTYTDANELHTLTDAADNTTTWLYDGAGRTASETNELSDARTYKYDGFGRLEENIDRNGRKTTYEYDNLGHLTAENWWTGGSITSTISYAFNALGLLESASDDISGFSYSFGYDDLNRLTSVTQTLSGLTPTVVFAHEYDAASRLATAKATIGSTGTTADYKNTYTRDALGRLSSLTQAGQSGGNTVAGKRLDFTYQADSRLTNIQRYAGTSTSNPVASTDFAYDDAGRLTSIHHVGLASGADFEEEHSYSYDDANRLTGYSSSLDGLDVAYEYDGTGQLTSQDRYYNDIEWEDTTTYIYDANGNRNQVDLDQYDWNYGSGPHFHFESDQDYSTGDDNRLLSDGTHGYTYDDEGNRTAKFTDTDDDGVWDSGEAGEAYTWDYRNRLTKVTYKTGPSGTATKTVDYVYDALGQMIKRTYDADGAATSAAIDQTFFLYDDGQVALEFHKTGTGSVAASNLKHRYLWGDGVDQLFTDEQVTTLSSAGTVLWAMTDHLGSVTDVIDSNGDLRIHREYDAYGRVLQEVQYGSTVYVAFGFTGRWIDTVTAQQNNLHRWYDALVGSWISQDPIGLGPDANPYRYVHNQPTMMVDPNGVFAEPPGQGNGRRLDFENEVKEELERRLVATAEEYANRFINGELQLAQDAMMQRFGVNEEDIQLALQVHLSASPQPKVDAMLAAQARIDLLAGEDPLVARLDIAYQSDTSHLLATGNVEYVNPPLSVIIGGYFEQNPDDYGGSALIDFSPRPNPPYWEVPEPGGPGMYGIGPWNPQRPAPWVRPKPH